jgi:hypothetical protein
VSGNRELPITISWYRQAVAFGEMVGGLTSKLAVDSLWLLLHNSSNPTLCTIGQGLPK